MPFVQDGEKAYRFTVRWGVETDTDDAEGKVVRDQRRAARRAPRSRRCCRASSATIMQMPPQFSAIKIDGERAYDLAREGETVDLQPRPINDPRAAT